MKSSDKIKDAIIFGSFVKGRPNPEDIDLALIVADKDLSLVTMVKNKLRLESVHVNLIQLEDVLSSTLFVTLLREGYSVKKDGFLRDKIGIKPMRIYIYNLKHLDKTKKTLFGIALKKNIQKTNGEKIGAGAVLIPIEQTSYFEDFLDVWGMKYKTRELTVF